MTQLRIIAGVWGLSPAQDGGNGARNGARREITQQNHPKKKKKLLSKLSFLSLGRINGMKPLSTSGSHFQIQDGLRAHSPKKPSVPTGSHPNSVCAALGKGMVGKDLESQQLPQNPAPASPLGGHGDGAVPHPLSPGGNSSIFHRIKWICCPVNAPKGEK